MVSESSGDSSFSNKVNASDNEPRHLNESDIKDSVSTDAYVERMRARQKAFDCFRREFKLDNNLGCIRTTVINNEGRADTIEIRISPNAPEVESIDLDQEEPVRFFPTKTSLHFSRYEQPKAEIVTEQQPQNPDEIKLHFSFFDDTPTVEELDKKAIEFNKNNSSEKIQTDLQKKFAGLGFPHIPLIAYARRMFNVRDNIKKVMPIKKADIIMPLYRSLEIKRLLTDPTSADVDYLSIVTRRQHVYNQLMGLLHETGMSPSNITEYMMWGVFDSNVIAGVPVFTDGKDHYIVIDYAFGGYDECQPTGTDFEGSFKDRSNLEIHHILDRAEKHGYSTRFYGDGVSGGTHQHWQWHGIKIEGYDKDHIENNVPKILKILNDIGIDPEEAASSIDPGSVSDLYMR